jgi:hypothetical protein
MNETARAAITVRIARDHLYIESASYDRHFALVASVALLRECDNLLVLPILGRESGGFYVKQVNARGDRAIHAADFLRLHGIDETIELSVTATWDPRLAGFSIRDLFAHEVAVRTRK